MAELAALVNVTAGYGEARVLDDVTLTLDEGDSMALLGRNGVGKSTLLMTLMGITRVHRGSVRFAGREVTKVPTHQRARAGLGWVPQERLMWPTLTVAEHLTTVARPGEWTLRRVYAMFPRLLSGGEQQMVAIGRALMLNPRLLLLDEPMEGLAPMIVLELMNVIRELAKSGNMGIVVVEQHASLALSITRQAVVLDRGRVVHHADSAGLLHDPETLRRLVSVA
jgi:branched-chain amino acid transport system ATP-binding protein